jgi:hypothetical protein
MNSSSSSKYSNPNPKYTGAICGGSLKCYHGLPAQMRIAKQGSRLGNKFYGCANWPVSVPNSGFFFLEKLPWIIQPFVNFPTIIPTID